MFFRSQWKRRSPVLGAALFLVLGMGCAGISIFDSAARGGFDYFQPPRPDDAWSPKIEGWQRRERLDDQLLEPLESGPAVASAGDHAARTSLPKDQADANGLRAQYFQFRAERKRALAREIADWVQSEARDHYRDDGPVDHWATFEETLARGGDDCDGLELLAFHALRDLGFSTTEVYRAIVVRPSDGQHHMVTLWFENADDPWVIDPTGAMTLGMPHMSDMTDWVPIKLFSEDLEYTVRDRSNSYARIP